MKKSEIAMIILIASVSVLVAYFVAKAVFKTETPQTANVKTAIEIKSDLAPVDPKIFNSSAINPTIQVEITNASGTQ